MSPDLKADTQKPRSSDQVEFLLKLQNKYLKPVVLEEEKSVELNEQPMVEHHFEVRRPVLQKQLPLELTVPEPVKL